MGPGIWLRRQTHNKKSFNGSRSRRNACSHGPLGKRKNHASTYNTRHNLPKKGQILLNDRDITNLPIERRNIGYLPQDYGLFPHLKVIDNVAYGLRVRGVSKEEREKTARQTIESVELQGFENRKPRELSGGQRQRVALARALAIKPELFLLDEPLANIDEVTKLDVAKHLKELLHKLKMPTILVTHNREDALFLAERLAIMVEGRIEQIGTVKEILESPKTSMIRRLLTPITQQ